MSLAINSRRAGFRAESTVIQLVDELRPVPDSEHQHHDAITTTLLTPSRQLPFGSIPLLERGTVVEIKSAAVVITEQQRKGRFLIRESQHEHLLSEAGSYLFAVASPDPDRELLAMKIVPASIVDELLGTWIERDSRARYCQLTWSAIFAVDEIRGDQR